MSFLISDAWAQQAPAAGGEAGIVNFVFLIAIFIIFYFLLLRPQMKRAKEHKKMCEALAKNDEVVTNGGVVGRVSKVDENFVALEVAQGVTIQVQKSAIASLLPKGTFKS